jgi:hypothetical protein
MKYPALVGGIILFAGCAGPPPDPRPGPDHPASPGAAEAPPPPVSHTLDITADEAADVAPRETDVGAHAHGHAHHGHAAPPTSAPTTAPDHADHASHEGHHP